MDDVLIRVFQNHEASGQPFPVSQPMKVYSSLFDASSWATQGGLVKIDWTQAPFVASYSDYVLDACFWDTTLPRPECATPQAGMHIPILGFKGELASDYFLHTKILIALNLRESIIESIIPISNFLKCPLGHI